MPTHIHAHGSLAPTEVDADAGIFLAYDNGAHALLSCSLMANIGARAEIVGTQGRIELVDPMFNPTAVVINGVEHAIEDEGYQHQIRAVEESIAAGLTENPRITWANTLEVMRTLEEVLRQMGVSYASVK